MMFDQLHDPDPPAPTGHHLAEVAERAAGMRRRRTAAVSGMAVVGVLAAGTIAIAASRTGDSGEVEFAELSLPAASPAGPETVDPPAPTTTVLDPASLPPAVPVNPDPDDLRPAVPVDADEADDGGDGSLDDGGAADGGSDGGTSEQPDDDEPAAGSGDSGATDEGGADDAAPTLDASTAAALRSADPVVAITQSGAAVWFASLDQDPIVADANGGASRLDFLGDGTSTIERNGGGSITMTAIDGDLVGTLDVGVAHEVGPDGETVCGLVDGGTAVACTTRAGERKLYRDAAAAPLGGDLTWLDGDTVLVLGRSAAWTLTTVDLADGSVTTSPFASTADFERLRFAGRDASGAIVLHDAGTEVVLAGTLDRYRLDNGQRGDGGDGAGGSALDVRRFDEPMRSVWYDGGTALLVTTDGTLRVDGTEVVGTYVTARR